MSNGENNTSELDNRVTRLEERLNVYDEVDRRTTSIRSDLHTELRSRMWKYYGIIILVLSFLGFTSFAGIRWMWDKTKHKLNNIHRVWSNTKSPLVSTQQIAKHVGIDWHTAEKYLKKLEEMGLVKRFEIHTNKKKMTYWEKRKRLKDKSTESI